MLHLSKILPGPEANWSYRLPLTNSKSFCSLEHSKLYLLIVQVGTPACGNKDMPHMLGGGTRQEACQHIYMQPFLL